MPCGTKEVRRQCQTLPKDRGNQLTAVGGVGRVGQTHIYTVHTRYFWQGNHQIYGRIRCIYTVLARSSYRVCIERPR